MKQILFIISFSLFSYSSFAADNYSIYLVRHAEKLADSKNPALTTCGKARAKLLASMLSKANITAIYSTSYQRTMQTARPLADLHKMAIKNYSPKHLEQFALQLKQKRENSLVVGHSNTTPMLVGLLTKQEIAPLTEQDYQYLYQVQVINEGTLLTVLQQPLVCKKPQIKDK